MSGRGAGGKDGGKAKTGGKAKSRSSRAGLQFPVSRLQRLTAVQFRLLKKYFHHWDDQSDDADFRSLFFAFPFFFCLLQLSIFVSLINLQVLIMYFTTAPQKSRRKRHTVNVRQAF